LALRRLAHHYVTPDSTGSGVGDAWTCLTAEVGVEPVARLAATSHQRTAYPGETLVRVGQPRQVGVLVRGLLKLEAYFPGGQCATVRYVHDGAFFGLDTLFHPAPLSIRVVKAATVVHLDASTVIRVAHEFPAFGWFVARELAGTTLELPATIEEFGFTTVRQRIAGHLIHLSHADKLGVPPVARVTQQALADCVGSAREVVSRCLRSFKDQGLIGIAPRAICIVDEAGLASVAARLDPLTRPGPKARSFSRRRRPPGQLRIETA
jgi:CRP/FNR family transcriptional regulator, cyclic AMP receptor protein